VVPNSGFGSFSARVRIGASVNWSGYDTILGAGDWNGDHRPDLIARTPSGDLYLYTGSGGGRINPTPTLLATGWDYYDQIISPVDWNGDGLPDLIARKPDGSMWIALGRRDHTLAAPQEMPRSVDWDNYSTVLSGGDWNANGHHDLIARRADGSIWVFPASGGIFGTPFKVAERWNIYS
jgi:FG-GAP-like repeat